MNRISKVDPVHECARESVGDGARADADVKKARATPLLQDDYLDLPKTEARDRDRVLRATRGRRHVGPRGSLVARDVGPGRLGRREIEDPGARRIEYMLAARVRPAADRTKKLFVGALAAFRYSRPSESRSGRIRKAVVSSRTPACSR